MNDNRLQYALSCARLRVSDLGDQVWHSLVAKAERISFEDFSEACDLSGLLDEEETLDDYVATDDWAGAYKVEVDGKSVAFIQRAGFEFFFTDDGLPPTYVAPLDRLTNELMIDNGAAKVLLKPNDARIGGAYGFESEAVQVDHDLEYIEGDCVRLRLYRDGEVVAGLRVENGVIDSIYVVSGLRRQGLGTELLNRAEEFLGPIEHSDSLSDDGKAFRASFASDLEADVDLDLEPETASTKHHTCDHEGLSL